ncbi:hypothetical protein TL16_g09346 [Triparma laevis f. inornata]|uniref:PA domain-containing protein n=1 Tax=Triparma laevis f. inornata TaxID=1714386 RepID=A0A9W7B2I2_9STRA|nr:hypothetical protein TL16_g09346 [Triparma laevis f. inornata]
MLALSLLLVHPASGIWPFRRRKPAETVKHVLDDCGFGFTRKYLNKFNDQGYDDPRILRKLKKLDLEINFSMSSKEISKFLKSVARLVPELKKEKKKKKKVDRLLERRNELAFGRLIVDGAPANYQYIKASFGGDLPLRSYEIQFSNNDYGCTKSSSAEGRILVVMRGKCTYLEKASAAESSGASVLVVINEDNGDLFQLPSGRGDDAVDSVLMPTIPVVLVQHNALAALKEIENFDPYARAMLIPQDCNDDGCMTVHPTDFDVMSQFDSSGGKAFVDGGGGGELVAEFLSSSFGITIPDEAQLTLANPIDACTDLIDGEYLKDHAVLVRRGSCPFNSKIRRLQNVGARLVVMVDNESPSVLDRIGATTEQLNELYLPVLMITKEVGGQIERVVRDKEVREGGELGASEARKLVTQPRTGGYHHRTPPLLDQPWSRL